MYVVPKAVREVLRWRLHCLGCQAEGIIRNTLVYNARRHGSIEIDLKGEILSADQECKDVTSDEEAYLQTLFRICGSSSWFLSRRGTWST